MHTFLTSNLFFSFPSSFAFLPDPVAGESTSISSAMMVVCSDEGWLHKRGVTVTCPDARASESALKRLWLSFVALGHTLLI